MNISPHYVERVENLRARKRQAQGSVTGSELGESCSEAESASASSTRDLHHRHTSPRSQHVSLANVSEHQQDMSMQVKAMKEMLVEQEQRYQRMFEEVKTSRQSLLSRAQDGAIDAARRMSSVALITADLLISNGAFSLPTKGDVRPDGAKPDGAAPPAGPTGAVQKISAIATLMLLIMLPLQLSVGRVHPILSGLGCIADLLVFPAIGTLPATALVERLACMVPCNVLLLWSATAADQLSTEGTLAKATVCAQLFRLVLLPRACADLGLSWPASSASGAPEEPSLLWRRIRLVLCLYLAFSLLSAGWWGWSRLNSIAGIAACSPPDKLHDIEPTLSSQLQHLLLGSMQDVLFPPDGWCGLQSDQLERARKPVPAPLLSMHFFSMLFIALFVGLIMLNWLLWGGRLVLWVPRMAVDEDGKLRFKDEVDDDADGPTARSIDSSAKDVDEASENDDQPKLALGETTDPGVKWRQRLRIYRDLEQARAEQKQQLYGPLEHAAVEGGSSTEPKLSRSQIQSLAAMGWLSPSGMPYSPGGMAHGPDALPFSHGALSGADSQVALMSLTKNLLDRDAALQIQQLQANIAQINQQLVRRQDESGALKKVAEQKEREASMLRRSLAEEAQSSALALYMAETEMKHLREALAAAQHRLGEAVPSSPSVSSPTNDHNGGNGKIGHMSDSHYSDFMEQLSSAELQCEALDSRTLDRQLALQQFDDSNGKPARGSKQKAGQKRKHGGRKVRSEARAQRGT